MAAMATKGNGGHRRRSSLISAQNLRLFELPALMEVEEPPPVPPKDNTSMATHKNPSGPPSGSKRKRVTNEEKASSFLNEEVVGDADVHTPKRPRSRIESTSRPATATPSQQNSVRRRKGSFDLADLSHRHALSYSQAMLTAGRDSRFQEGSLNDLPSRQPPSIFTHGRNSGHGSLAEVDHLMSKYHDGAVEEATPTNKEGSAAHRAALQKNESSGLFRFGRSIAASFHPVTLWNRMWNESKEEVLQAEHAESDPRTKQKQAAEEAYALMKAEGQIPYTAIQTSVESATPRDSGIDFGYTDTSVDSSLVVPDDDLTSRSGSEALDSHRKPLRTIRSRLHLKRPSFSDIKNELKRVRSDFSLRRATNVELESSTSASPVKIDALDSQLRQSHSRYDLKKQQRLSKRVSDLENKLERARQELNEALIDASPNPASRSRLDLFTPSTFNKRTRFVPGGLPTLPSERLLFAGVPNFDEQSDASEAADMTNTDQELPAHLDIGSDNEETIRAPRGPKPAIPHVASLFDNPNSVSNESHKRDRRKSDIYEDTPALQSGNSSNLSTSTELSEMDLNSVPTMSHTAREEASNNECYSALDEKLKAVESRYKASRKDQSRKRKSTTADDDGLFKPDGQLDDGSDSEAEGSSRKKPRKNVNAASASTVRKSRSKIPRRSIAPPAATENETPAYEVGNNTNEELFTTNATEAEEEGHTLEPVYEDEEEENLASSVDASMLSLDLPEEGNTAEKIVLLLTTPSTRTRSASPRKRNLRDHRPRGRSTSPPPNKGLSPADELVDDVIKVTPGKKGVPALPKTKSAHRKHKKVDENFEWPDDVF